MFQCDNDIGRLRQQYRFEIKSKNSGNHHVIWLGTKRCQSRWCLFRLAGLLLEERNTTFGKFGFVIVRNYREYYIVITPGLGLDSEADTHIKFLEFCEGHHKVPEFCEGRHKLQMTVIWPKNLDTHTSFPRTSKRNYFWFFTLSCL